MKKYKKKFTVGIFLLMIVILWQILLTWAPKRMDKENIWGQMNQAVELEEE